MIAYAPQTKIVPPKRGLCPEEINRLGATGVQIEAQIGVFAGLTPLFWDEDLFFFFFFEITCFWPEKPLENLREELFFGKPLEFPISAGKSLAI